MPISDVLNGCDKTAADHYTLFCITSPSLAGHGDLNLN
jgi:hypothetical protein